MNVIILPGTVCGGGFIIMIFFTVDDTDTSRSQRHSFPLPGHFPFTGESIKNICFTALAAFYIIAGTRIHMPGRGRTKRKIYGRKQCIK